MTGLRDRVDVLWPATKTNPRTEETVPDWDAEPETVYERCPANVQPVSSSEQAVNATTVVARWDCWLTPGTPIDTTCRVRWDGAVYTVDGDVERWKTGRRVRRIHVLLKKVT